MKFPEYSQSNWTLHSVLRSALPRLLCSMKGWGWGGGGDTMAWAPQWLDHGTGDQLFRDKLHSNITCNIHLHKTNTLLYLKQFMPKMRSL
jgi:hypothetical protein